MSGRMKISKISKDKALESVNEKMGPKQYHSYLQYVFDTQFKTPEEKKMKKSMIKKINKEYKEIYLNFMKLSIKNNHLLQSLQQCSKYFHRILYFFALLK